MSANQHVALEPSSGGVEVASKTKAATAVPLHYSNMSGKEPHWEVDARGQISIPSLIPIFPKPLALSYRNYYKHYGEDGLTATERGYVTYPKTAEGSTFMSTLLRHYFTGPDHKVEQVWPGMYVGNKYEVQNLVTDVPVEGVHYFVVRETKPDKNIMAIFIMVVNPTFLQLPGRDEPTTLTVVKKWIDKKKRIAIDANTIMDRGTVVFLAGTWDPIAPTFEFYKFSSEQQGAGKLVPWTSDLLQTTDGTLTNSISLDPKYAGSVDAMFRGIRDE